MVGVVQQRVGLLQVVRAHDGVGVLLGGQEPLYHDHHVTQPSLALELQTKASDDFTITEKTPTMDFSWLKATVSAFTFHQLRHY